MIDLVLLGCGGNMPMPNRFLSSLFINYKGRKILIDCGEGTQVSMRMKNRFNMYNSPSRRSFLRSYGTFIYYRK